MAEKVVPPTLLLPSLLAFYSSYLFLLLAPPLVRNADVLKGVEMFGAAEIRNINRLELSSQSPHSLAYSTVLNLC